MTFQPSRRHFLQSTATASAALGLPSLAAFLPISPIRADDAVVTPSIVRSTPDLEGLIKLIDVTPREKCVPVLVEQLRSGLPYRQLLTAAFLAAVRKTNALHSVYQVHSVHQVSLDLPSEARLLPLLWAIDQYKWTDEQHGCVAQQPLGAAVPPPEKAAADFHEAMQKFDLERADRAVVGMARSEGARQTLEQLWIYVCRNMRETHKVISLANCARVLETIGCQHAEEVLRRIIYDIGNQQDQYYQSNVERVDKALGTLPAGWTGGAANRAATLELYALLRQAQPDQACELAVRQLASGIGAQAILDTLHVATADVMILYTPGTHMLGYPLHANTTADALHYGFRTCTTPRTRLLLLLQGLAWVCNCFGKPELRNPKDTTPFNLEGANLTGTPNENVAEIFAALPPRTVWFWSGKTRTGGGDELLKREERVEIGRKIFALASQHPEAVPLYMAAAYGWMVRKANVNSHEFKLPPALFESYGLVSPEWRPRLLVASAQYIHGSQSDDTPLLAQARDAVKTIR